MTVPISGLPAATGGDVTVDDLLPILDVAAGTTKRATVAQLATALAALPLAGGTMTGAIVGNKAAGAKFAILPLADSVTAFQVQTAAGANILNVNSTGSAVGIGTTTTSTVSKLIVGPYVTADVLANVHITAIAATHKPLVVQGFTAQTGNLQEWQSSAGTALTQVDSDGNWSFGSSVAINATYGQVNLSTTSLRNGNLLQSSGNIDIQTNGGLLYVGRWSDDLPLLAVNDANTGTRVAVKTGTATVVGLSVQGFTAQTADLQQWKNSAGTVLASVSSAGLGTFAGVTATALVLTAATATGSAGFRMPHGTAPTTPVDGDLWTTTAGMFVRINGVTKTVTLT
jgi:hypothetical protein